MKKTVISLMLALAMVFSLVLVAAPAAEAAAHTDHCVCGGKTAGVGDHTKCTTLTGWQDLNQVVNGSSEVTVLETGNYYLSADLHMEITGTTKRGLEFAKGAVVTICLNGYKLSCNTRVFYAQGTITEATPDAPAADNHNEVSICDCKGTGVVDCKNAAIDGPILYMKEKAIFSVYGGTIIGSNQNTKAGGAIRVQGGTFNMYGGTVKDGCSETLGGNFYINGTANLYGGTITNGNGLTGGNIHVTASGKLLIDGASIANGGYTDLFIKNDIDILGEVTVKSFAKAVDAANAEVPMLIKRQIVLETDGVTVKDEGTLVLSGKDTAFTSTTANVQGGESVTLTYKAPPAPPAKPNNPATGDSANLVVMGLGLVLGVAGMACLLPKKHG